MCCAISGPITLFIIVSIVGAFDYPKSPPYLAPTVSERECQKIIKTFPAIPHFKIQRGDLAELGEIPHMVAIGYEKSGMLDYYEFLCGGSLLSSTFVLSSASCGNAVKGKATIARVGAIDISNDKLQRSTDFGIAEAIVHPNYTVNPYIRHDISLLRLSNSVQFNSDAFPVCLYTEKDDPKVLLTASGWGATAPDWSKKSLLLRKVDITLLDHKNCKQAVMNAVNESYFTEDHICSRDPEEKRDTCRGDTGGPLQGLTSGSDGHYRLVGIISFGARKCGAGTIFTRVSSYRYWIEDIVWPEQDIVNRANDIGHKIENKIENKIEKERIWQ